MPLLGSELNASPRTNSLRQLRGLPFEVQYLNNGYGAGDLRHRPTLPREVALQTSLPSKTEILLPREWLQQGDKQAQEESCQSSSKLDLSIGAHVNKKMRADRITRGD